MWRIFFTLSELASAPFLYLCSAMLEKLSKETDVITAFEQAYSSYLHRVEHYAYSFVADYEQARSIAQDTFVKLWEKRMEVDFSKEVLPFLFVLTKNNCLNFLRREKIKNKHSDFTAYRVNQFNMEVLDHPASVNVYSKEVQKLIRDAYQAMPEKVRETFLLSRDSDLKNREIAQKQNIGISTVEFRISCAFKILRKYLKDYLPILLWFLPPNV
jgi:RNA polymerase sigma-70 factor, ECF subfamily